MMGIFGGLYPPGCHGTPYDDPQATDLTKLVTVRRQGVEGVFWDEDGRIIEVYPVKVPADPDAGIPEYTDTYEDPVCSIEWNDALDDDANMRAAAGRYEDFVRVWCAVTATEVAR